MCAAGYSARSATSTNSIPHPGVEGSALIPLQSLHIPIARPMMPLFPTTLNTNSWHAWRKPKTRWVWGTSRYRRPTYVLLGFEARVLDSWRIRSWLRMLASKIVPQYMFCSATLGDTMGSAVRSCTLCSGQLRNLSREPDGCGRKVRVGAMSCRQRLAQRPTGMGRTRPLHRGGPRFCRPAHPRRSSATDGVSKWW